MEERRVDIGDLKWKIDTLEKEMAQLGPERLAAESYAAEAVRIAKHRDTEVEELCQW
jgi:hypothetical protein